MEALCENGYLKRFSKTFTVNKLVSSISGKHDPIATSRLVVAHCQLELSSLGDIILEVAILASFPIKTESTSLSSRARTLNAIFLNPRHPPRHPPQESKNYRTTSKTEIDLRKIGSKLRVEQKCRWLVDVVSQNLDGVSTKMGDGKCSDLRRKADEGELLKLLKEVSLMKRLLKGVIWDGDEKVVELLCGEEKRK
ncbi:unnamed protein product [Vicia faba]|uniref:Uncharacterized protein n=1 Tax=Vicia faba TaxID=3906 RepID=A0AAV0ZPD0_VICFA|nr:unnamed protein product [Vicia faba]